MGGGSGNIYAPSKSDTAGQNANFTGLSNQATGFLQQYIPQITSSAGNITQQILNNPYNPQAQAGSNIASAYGTNVAAPSMAGAASNLSGLGGLASGYAPQALQTGFDPQNALYNREFQRNQDQTNAIAAQYGVSGTPYGAGVAGNAANNFNLDWADRALQRQSTAAGTAGQLAGTAGNAFVNSANLNNEALNTYNTAAGLPAQTYQQQLKDFLSALSGQNTVTGGALGMSQNQMGQILNYLGYANKAQTDKQQAENATFGGLGQIFGTLLSPITSAFGGLGSLFGGGGTLGAANTWANNAPYLANGTGGYGG